MTLEAFAFMGFRLAMARGDYAPPVAPAKDVARIAGGSGKDRRASC
jgi:hypothetical protein